MSVGSVVVKEYFSCESRGPMVAFEEYQETINNGDVEDTPFAWSSELNASHICELANC